MKLTIPVIPRRIILSLISVIGAMYWLFDKSSEDVAMVAVMCIVVTCVVFLFADLIGYVVTVQSKNEKSKKFIDGVIASRYCVASITAMILVLSIVKRFLIE